MISDRASRFTESVIRGMTILCNKYGGINLAQGFPDWDVHPSIKEAAKRAIDDGYNQYAITWGSPRLRAAIAKKMREYNGIDCHPDENIVVTCGATEAMIASMLAVVNPGEEVVIFEPFYENYGPDAILSGAVPRYVPIHTPDFRIDPDELRSAFSRKTKAIIVNTPNNPLGKVFSEEDLRLVAELCREFDVVAITDEIYEHILYDGKKHISIATLPGMKDRTVTICGFSKTYSITGWRLAYTVACKEITEGIKRVHDFLTVGAAAPLQEAAVEALSMPEDFYAQLRQDYTRKRDTMLAGLEEAGFSCVKPEGAYYIMADISPFGFRDDVTFARWLVKEIGIAAVPGSSFYYHTDLGRQQIRFCFCKKDETLYAAAEKLRKVKSRI